MKDVTPCGPLFREIKPGCRNLRVFFKNAEVGLICRGEALKGFAIAGEDRTFVWASAQIEGDTVVVSSPTVPAPLFVRYGWADNPICNLYNMAGFPASPFRSDVEG